MPDLSAGITCSFGQQAQMEGHVNGNRVMCLSPAGKEVPKIPEGQGELRSNQPQGPNRPVGLLQDVSE